MGEWMECRMVEGANWLQPRVDKGRLAAKILLLNTTKGWQTRVDI